MDRAAPAATIARVSLLGLDVGTAAVRAALLDEATGALVAHEIEPLRMHGRRGARELDLESTWATVTALLGRLRQATAAEARAVRRVAIAATASTVAAFDADLQPIGRGIAWADHRAAREAEEIRSTGHPVLGRTLGHVSPEWGLPKLLHLWRADRSGGSGGSRRRRPMVHVLELLDWLHWKLTGRLVANSGIREWGWCVADDGRWSADLVDRLGIRDALRLVPQESVRTGELVAPIRPELAASHPLLAGASVTMGGMDSYLAGLGQGVMREGRLALSFGSSSSLLARHDLGDARGHLYGPFRSILPGPADGYWHGGQSTAGLAVEWAGRLLARAGDLEAHADRVPHGSEGLVFRETFLDRRTPEPQAGLRAAWDGLSLSHGPGHLYRSVLESIAFGMRWAAVPLRPTEVVVTGGLARSRLFLTILASVLGRPVGVLRHELATVTGAAFAHDPERLTAVNPVVEWIEPGGIERDVALEQSFRRYRALHTLPHRLGGAPAGRAMGVA